jgi:hypothetical protein
VRSPWGEASDELLFGRLGGQQTGPARFASRLVKTATYGRL